MVWSRQRLTETPVVIKKAIPRETATVLASGCSATCTPFHTQGHLVRLKTGKVLGSDDEQMRGS